jgi:hypothetical protein
MGCFSLSVVGCAANATFFDSHSTDHATQLILQFQENVAEKLKARLGR